MKINFIRHIEISKGIRMSSSIASVLPLGVRGMKVLDREQFSRSIMVPTLNVLDDNLAKATQICKPYFLKLENFKPVQSLLDKSESPGKCIYFDPYKVDKWSDLSEDNHIKLNKLNINEKHFNKQEVVLTYDNFKYDVIFKAVLPEDEEIVSGFSQIGHIIHLNLREHLLDYRQLIGQVLIDKIKTCRTVVNKSNVIDNTYRNFSMEVIAGEEDFLVTVKENRCNFKFDFSKVYWNPRLSKEHERILEFFKPGDILFDVFCGVGPFAVPAAKRKCRVFANDLNPDSFKWLNHNARENKVNIKLFKSFNKDGKDFIYNDFKTFILEYCNGSEELENGVKVHITMNLPALAVEFLKYFKGLINEMEIKNKPNCDIIVYVYCFTIGNDPYAVAKQLVNDNLQEDISKHIIDVFAVRNVSPKKEMMRVSLKLNELLYQCHSEINSEPPSKKLCINEK